MLLLNSSVKLTTATKKTMTKTTKMMMLILMKSLKDQIDSRHWQARAVETEHIGITILVMA